MVSLYLVINQHNTFAPAPHWWLWGDAIIFEQFPPPKAHVLRLPSLTPPCTIILNCILFHCLCVLFIVDLPFSSAPSMLFIVMCMMRWCSGSFHGWSTRIILDAWNASWRIPKITSINISYNPWYTGTRRVSCYKVSRQSRIMVAKFLHHCRAIRASHIPSDDILDQLRILLSMCHQLRSLPILPWSSTLALITASWFPR